MDIYSRIFRKLNLTVVSLWIITALLVIGLSFFLTDPKQANRHERSRIREIEDSVKVTNRQFVEAGDYSWIEKFKKKTETVSGGPEEKIAFSTDEWKRASTYIFGNKYLMDIAVGFTGEKTYVDPKNQMQIQFPNIEIAGVTYNRQKTRVVTTVIKDGRSHIWLWTFEDDKWFCRNIPRNFKIGEVNTEEGNFEFSLISREDPSQDSRYIYSADDRLSEYTSDLGEENIRRSGK